MHIANEHIKELVRTGNAIIVSVDVANRFGKHIDNLPWLPSGSGLDWSQIDGNRANLSNLTESQLLNWLESTPMKSDPYLIFWYAIDEPCIMCKSAFAISNIDLAFWKAPGSRYIFGASICNEEINPNFTHFAEYDGADTIIAAR